MVKLTAVGLRNYIDKTRERRDAREQAIMSIYSKTGGIGLRKIFGSSSPTSFGRTATTTDNLESTDGTITKSYLGTPDVSTKNLAIAENLIENFGMSRDAVARLAIDPTSFERLQTSMDSLKEQYADKKGTVMTKELATQEIGNLLESAIFKQPTTSGKLNISAIEKYVGRELDGLYKAMLQEEQMASGAVVFPERVLIETPDVSKVPGFEKAAFSSTYRRALTEQANVRREVAKLTAIDKDPNINLNPFQKNELDWYVKRNMDLTKAVNLYDKGLVEQLAILYGGSTTRELVKNYPNFEELAPIQELISLSEAAPPVRVPANMAGGQDQEQFLKTLLQMGILKIGDRFILYDPFTEKVIREDYLSE